MDLSECRYDGGRHCDLSKVATSAHVDKSEKPDYLKRTEDNTKKMGVLQDKLYADNREGVVILFQAMDAAGKDSTIKHVMTGINPQGVDVHSFKVPSSEELSHDYLWRVNNALPARGRIGIFNRSYYEDVLVVRVHELQKGYSMPKRCIDDDDFWEKRFRQLRYYEEYLYENGYRLLKVFLNVGPDEQKKRFLERIDDPAKNWKFSSADLKERELWPKYMEAYEDAIDNTSTKHNPWYVIPADQKWVARYLVSEAVVDVLSACDPAYPVLPDEAKANLEQCRATLTGSDS